MKGYRNYILVLIVVTCLLGCHSARRIKIENRSEGEAEITWVLKEDSLTKSRLFISNSDTVRYALHNKKPHNKLKMSFGVGTWTPAELLNFADDLMSFQIKWNSGLIKIDSTAQIVDFLRLRRRGMDNSQISIVVK